MFFIRFYFFLTDGEIPKNVLMARLMTQRYKNALVSHRDKNIFIPGLSAITGYTQLPLKCKKGTQSSSSYTFIKRVILAVDSITSFSSKPLKYIFYIGIIILLFSVIYIIYLILMKFFNAFSVDGWTSLIVSIYFLCGLILSSLGVLAIYLSIYIIRQYEYLT